MEYPDSPAPWITRTIMGGFLLVGILVIVHEYLKYFVCPPPFICGVDHWPVVIATSIFTSMVHHLVGGG